MDSKKLLSAADKQSEDYKKSAQNLKQVRQSIEDVQKCLEELVEHPRVSCRIPISDYFYVDGLLCTSEYLVKHGDQLVLKSYPQTNEYMENIIKNIDKDLEAYTDGISFIDNSLNIASSVACYHKSVDTHLGKLLYHEDGTVEIIEFEDEVQRKAVKRHAKFKTAKERDEYLKNIIK